MANIERRERLNGNEMGVFEEVADLKATLAWGPAGVEAVLATLIPEKDSLFFGKMEVMQARRQYEELENVLVNSGCEVVRVRDLAARALVERGGVMPATSLVELRSKILEKAEALIAKYGLGMGEVTDCIAEILVEDVHRYGEEAAIRLNAELAQIETVELPLANILFGRDQSNMVGRNLLWSRMRHGIRGPEVDLWRLATGPVMEGVEVVIVNGEGRLEGGDAIVHNGVCLMGVGGRSNLAGVEQIAPVILGQGLKLMVVYHRERDMGLIEHQTTMHLDTFYMPGPKNTVVVLMEEAQERRVLEVVIRGGKMEMEDRGSFAEYILASGADIIPLTLQQQLDYQANFVVLSRDSVLLTTCGDGYLKAEFEKRGIRVVDGNLSAITQGYGGAHCSLTPIWRV